MCRQGGYGEFLYLPLNSFIKLKLVFKKTLSFFKYIKTKVTIFKPHHTLIIYISIVFLNRCYLNRGNWYMLPSSTCVGGGGIVWLSEHFSHL